MITVDALELVQKGPAHDYLAKLFDFPDYYGRNLDALNDCLEEQNNEIEIINHDKAAGYYLKVYKVLKMNGAVIKTED